MKKFFISIMAVLFCSISFAQNHNASGLVYFPVDNCRPSIKNPDDRQVGPSIGLGFRDDTNSYYYGVSIMMDDYYSGNGQIERYNFDATSALLIKFEDGSVYKLIPTGEGKLDFDVCSVPSFSKTYTRWYRTSLAEVVTESDVPLHIALATKKIIKTRNISYSNDFTDYDFDVNGVTRKASSNILKAMQSNLEYVKEVVAKKASVNEF